MYIVILGFFFVAVVVVVVFCVFVFPFKAPGLRLPPQAWLAFCMTSISIYCHNNNNDNDNNNNNITNTALICCIKICKQMRQRL